MQITDNIKPIDPAKPDPELILEAVDVIRQGGIVVFPTTGLYGLGGDAFNPKAVDRVFSLKRRPLDKPVLVLVKSPNELFAIVQDVPPAAVSIMEKFWPGHVTLVFKASDHLPDNLMAGTRKIGVRVPVHPVGRALVKKLGTPLTGTSANLSGKPGCSLVSEIGPAITDHVDFVLDAGLLKGGTGSTVVDVTGETPTVLREGEIAAQDIFAAVKKPAQT